MTVFSHNLIILSPDCLTVSGHSTLSAAAADDDDVKVSEGDVQRLMAAAEQTAAELTELKKKHRQLDLVCTRVFQAF